MNLMISSLLIPSILSSRYLSLDNCIKITRACERMTTQYVHEWLHNHELFRQENAAAQQQKESAKQQKQTFLFIIVQENLKLKKSSLQGFFVHHVVVMLMSGCDSTIHFTCENFIVEGAGLTVAKWHLSNRKASHVSWCTPNMPAHEAPKSVCTSPRSTLHSAAKEVL